MCLLEEEVWEFGSMVDWGRVGGLDFLGEMDCFVDGCCNVGGEVCSIRFLISGSLVDEW